MNVASLELCRELYELSGWHDTFAWYKWGNAADLVWEDKATWTEPEENTMQYDWDKSVPAYDLGYLLRKLPTHLDGVYDLVVSPTHSGTRWLAAYCDPDGENQYDQFADTPEDAACKLAIELFKQNILKPAGEGA